MAISHWLVCTVEWLLLGGRAHSPHTHVRSPSEPFRFLRWHILCEIGKYPQMNGNSHFQNWIKMKKMFRISSSCGRNIRRILPVHCRTWRNEAGCGGAKMRTNDGKRRGIQGGRRGGGERRRGNEIENQTSFEWNEMKVRINELHVYVAHGKHWPTEKKAKHVNYGNIPVHTKYSERHGIRDLYVFAPHLEMTWWHYTETVTFEWTKKTALAESNYSFPVDYYDKCSNRLDIGVDLASNRFISRIPLKCALPVGHLSGTSDAIFAHSGNLYSLWLCVGRAVCRHLWSPHAISDCRLRCGKMSTDLPNAKFDWMSVATLCVQACVVFCVDYMPTIHSQSIETDGI